MYMTGILPLALPRSVSDFGQIPFSFCGRALRNRHHWTSTHHHLPYGTYQISEKSPISMDHPDRMGNHHCRHGMSHHAQQAHPNTSCDNHVLHSRNRPWSSHPRIPHLFHKRRHPKRERSWGGRDLRLRHARRDVFILADNGDVHRRACGRDNPARPIDSSNEAARA